MSSLNGGVAGRIPPDLEYPCIIFSCSGETEHKVGCDGSCDTWEPKESEVKLQNLSREYARNGMVAVGKPKFAPIPMSGIDVDLLELLCRMIALEDIVFELVDIDREEFDEKYRQTKIEFLTVILDANKEHVRKQQVANTLGIVEGKPPLLGPDGTPIG